MTNQPPSSAASPSADTVGSTLPPAPPMAFTGDTLHAGLTTFNLESPSQPGPLGPDEVDLEEPISRGSQSITRVLVRRPRSDELRGIQLAQLLSMDVNSLHIVLPRITQPMITKPEAENLSPADLLQLGEKVVGFLLKKADRQQFQSE